MTDQKKFLQQALEKNHQHFSAMQLDQIITYVDLLQQWNRVFNLTAIRNFADIIVLHILDSLSINEYLQGMHILDVGTGAGLPGIPLAIANPDKQFTLLDSNSKKTRFLTQAVHELKLNNVEIIHSRCENFHPEKCFDTIVSRAFASINVMLENTQHLICKKGIFLAMKGVLPTQEIAEINQNYNVLATHKLIINGLDAERCVVCITKK